MKGVIFAIILGKFDKVYFKYVLIFLPSSIIMSKKLTACTIHIIKLADMADIKKNKTQSERIL